MAGTLALSISFITRFTLSVMASVSELESQLAEYDEQLAGVEELLVEDPNNEEYVALKESILSLVDELKQLISAAATNAKPAPIASESESVDRDTSKEETAKVAEQVARPETVIENGPAQVEEALKRGLYVGLPSEAVWPEDGLWYPAVIETISEAGVRVKFKSYGDVVTLKASLVRVSSALSTDTKKRKEPSSGTTETPESSQHDLPENIRFADTDTEKVREWKKRQQKNWKQEKRKERQEIAENKSMVSWQTFNKGLKKTGFGAKRESMFRTAEGYNSKVGVVQSGKTKPHSATPQSTAAPRYTATGTAAPQHPSNQPAYDPLAAPAYYIPGAQNQPQYGRPSQRY